MLQPAVPMTRDMKAERARLEDGPDRRLAGRPNRPIAFAGPVGQVSRERANGGGQMAEEAEKPKRKLGLGALAIGLIILAAIAFILVNALGDRDAPRVDLAAGKQFPCTVQSVYDGDGPINCAEVDAEGKQVSLRLRGIEAREPDNSCQTEVCPPLSGEQAKAALTRLAVGRLQCLSYGPSYNRVDAFCRNASGQDLSCEMLRSGTAVRWAQYDPDGRLLPCVRPQPGGSARQ
jgi:endonuclease YncB( thermonuclease family)